MLGLSARRFDWQQLQLTILSLAILLIFLPLDVRAQGNGRASSGTGGIHLIQGYVFFPSGRRAEGSIEVKLQSYNSGEISVLADNGGSFTFTSLSPGNYTVVVNAGNGYEVARESVFIDTDINPARGIALPSVARRYTVMVHLQPKNDRGNHAKASVVNAGLAEVPAEARKLYEDALVLSQTDTNKAIDNLKAAISRYPNFPLALNELGVQYLKLGQAAKAIGSLKEAAKLSPEAFTPKLNLGIALLEATKFTEAETQLRDAVKQNETAPTAHLYLGVTLAKLQNYPEAEVELNRAIELGGNRMGLAHYYLGGVYWQKREYRRAAEELETYLSLTPNAANAAQVRATIKSLRTRS
jgi:tetratricopeptide (TPR) repeat protein